MLDFIRQPIDDPSNMKSDLEALSNIADELRVELDTSVSS